MKQIKSCPNCDQKNFTTQIKCTDHTVSKASFTLSQCTSCELIFTNPRPAEKELGTYYKSEEYISHTNNKKGWFNKLYQLARKINIKSKLNIIGNLKGELLEIGSGTGDLLNACKKVGWSVKGVEPNLTARNNAKQNFGLDLFETLEQAKIEDKSQDTIMMWHVLEHVPNLKEITQKINNLLNDSGKLIIAVPNHESLDAKYYKQHWAAYDVPRHLLHFNKKSMANTLKNAGFEIINIKPMTLDSFYVSMLSEKIRSGNKNPIKAITIGMTSNIHSFLFNKEYSSLIYIAKKRL
jgi:predicted SAM-dependent methyltransferase